RVSGVAPVVIVRGIRGQVSELLFVTFRPINLRPVNVAACKNQSAGLEIICASFFLRYGNAAGRSRRWLRSRHLIRRGAYERNPAKLLRTRLARRRMRYRTGD